ncbi:PREDICTED: serine/arginine-rich SC35-like splicing factor SCL30 isoform X2 [Camelina sativa]|uniref:Serine/arginine-rich SC35-like splicing factor SCL30 isoform X2 n=1 Tax=Camelina sativa TaxID=90675 RepID=A0ABM0YQG1_CAMSA|nr:PREDICTED: serine/arginine-rich SC35-like splicing factor SCL30 isoform X2 [Camelina sativa]
MRRYSPPYYSPPRRGYGGRGRSPPPPPRRGYGGGRKGSSHGSLLVRNIPLDCRPEELRAPFERFGPVRDVYIPRDYYSGEPRGFAFVEFVDAYDAGEAQRSMNRRIFAGREITVVVASESRKRPEEMRVKTRTRSREPSGSRGRSRSRSISRSRSPRRPSDSRSRYRSRSYSPAPRRRGADYSPSPRRRQEERPRSPPRGPPRGEDGKYSRRSYSPGYEGDAAPDRDRNGDTEIREKPGYEPEERRRGGRAVSRSPSGSKSVEASPR